VHFHEWSLPSTWHCQIRCQRQKIQLHLQGLYYTIIVTNWYFLLTEKFRFRFWMIKKASFRRQLLKNLSSLVRKLTSKFKTLARVFHFSSDQLIAPSWIDQNKSFWKTKCLSEYWSQNTIWMNYTFTFYRWSRYWSMRSYEIWVQPQENTYFLSYKQSSFIVSKLIFIFGVISGSWSIQNHVQESSRKNKLIGKFRFQ